MNTFKLDRKKEFGDFQTPSELAELMIQILKDKNIQPDIIVEPTCGMGNILMSAYKNFSPKETIGIEINKNYCTQISKWIADFADIKILNKDIFNSIDILKKEMGKYNGCLFIGNTPWVTNAELSAINSINLPVKKNIKELLGI